MCWLLPGLLGLCDMCFLLGTTYDDSAGLGFKNSLPWIGRPVYWLKHAISNGEINANVGPHQLVRMLLLFSPPLLSIVSIRYRCTQTKLFLGPYLQDQSTILDDKTPGIVRQEEIVELLLQPRPEIVACRAWFGWESENFWGFEFQLDDTNFKCESLSKKCGSIRIYIVVLYGHFFWFPDSQLSGFVTATPQHDFAESSARLQGWLLPAGHLARCLGCQKILNKFLRPFQVPKCGNIPIMTWDFYLL